MGNTEPRGARPPETKKAPVSRGFLVSRDRRVAVARAGRTGNDHFFLPSAAKEVM